MSESSNVNVEVTTVSAPSRLTRIKDRTLHISKNIGNAVVTGSNNALVATEAAVLTVTEPVVVVAKEAGSTYSDKYQSIRENSKLRAGRRAIKRAERDARRVVEAQRILAAAQVLPEATPVVVAAPAPAKRARKAPATA